MQYDRQEIKQRMADAERRMTPTVVFKNRSGYRYGRKMKKDYSEIKNGIMYALLFIMALMLLYA